MAFTGLCALATEGAGRVLRRQETMRTARGMRNGFALWLFGAVVAAAAPAGAAPSRIVSISVCTDEFVFRLVPRERIAALSYLAADKHPVVSTIADRVRATGIRLIHQTAEEILAAKPDVVVMDEGSQARVRAILAQADIPVIDVPWANSVDEVRKGTRELAARLDARAAGERLLAQMDAELAQARAMAPRPPVTALIYEPNGYAASGGMTDAMMSAAGLVNAAPHLHLTRQGTIPVEAVVAAAPQLLILGTEAGAADSRAREVQLHPAFAALAGRTRRVWLSTTALLCPGPWSAQAALGFATAARAER
jgi:iron complex transport system substrate-binding protein